MGLSVNSLLFYPLILKRAREVEQHAAPLPKRQPLGEY